MNLQTRIADKYFERGVTVQNMVEHLLYDGAHLFKDHIQFTDIRLHNDNILTNLQDHADNVSLLTSSLVNFLTSWQHSNKDKDK